MSAMNEAPGKVRGHLISPKDLAQRIPSQFVNKTRNFSHQTIY